MFDQLRNKLIKALTREKSYYESTTISVGAESLNADEEINEIAKFNPWLASAIRYISQNANRPRLMVVNSQDEEIKDVNLELFDRPNKYQTYSQFLSYNIYYYLLSGRCVNITEKIGSKTTMMLPIPSDGNNLSVELNANGDVVYRPVYRYGNALNPELMYDWKDGSLSTSLIDTHGKIEACLYQATTSNDIDKFNHAFLSNGAVPSGILTTEQKKSNIDIDDIKTKWNGLHSGRKKVGKTAILHAGLKYQQIGTSLNEMGYEKLKEVTRKEIIAVMQVPPVILGLTESVNRSNSEEQVRIFWNNVLIPMLNSLTDTWSNYFFPDEDKYFKYDYTMISELQKDLSTKLSDAERALRMGFDLADIVEKLELPFEVPAITQSQDDDTEGEKSLPFSGKQINRIEII